MRKLFLALLFLLIGGVANANPAILKGHVKNMNGKSVRIIITGGMTKTVAEAIVKDDKFEMNVPVDKPAFLLFWLTDGLRADILISPDAVMELDLTKTPVFKGDGANVNNLIVAQQEVCKAKEPVLVNNENFDAARSKAFCDSYSGAVNIIEDSNLSGDEKNCAIGYFQARLLKNLYARVGDSKVFVNPSIAINIMPDYNSNLPNIRFKPSVSWHPSWFSGMEEYMYAKVENKSLKIKNPTFWLTEFVSTLKEKSLQEDFVLESLTKDVVRGHIYKIGERIESVKRFVKSADGIATINGFGEKIAKEQVRFANCVEGTYLGDYFFNDAKGEKVHLKDFKGNYIFMDIWGTSCNPCLGEIPYMKKMEHELEGESIVFVSISTDRSPGGWRNFIVKNKLSGEQLITTDGFKDPFFNSIGLTGIPRFIIIDKEGKMFDHYAYRPSNPILKLKLKELLKK